MITYIYESPMSLENNNSNMETHVEKKYEGKDHKLPSSDQSRKKINWGLFLFHCFLLAAGTVGGPITIRFYYLNGGNSKWLPTWLQSAGFPVLFIPLVILYFRNKKRSMNDQLETDDVYNFAGAKLLLFSAFLGLILGLDNYLYTIGLSYLPLSTATILFSTQLAFTAVSAFVIVKQKFTTFSINAVVLMTLGSILLGLGKGSVDRPPNVGQKQYWIGFFMALLASAIVGVYLPVTEIAYAKGAGKKKMTYIIVTQVQIAVALSATIFSTVGMLVNHDFQDIPREAKEFKAGKANYYILLVSSAIAYQFVSVGVLGVIFCYSSLFCGILTSSMIPVTEVIAAIVFKEKFTGLKGMSLAMCLWGVISYFCGEYRMSKKIEEKIKLASMMSLTDLDSAPRTDFDSRNPV